MTLAQRLALISDASQKLQALADDMNTDGGECRSCGLMRQDNVTEYRIAEQLDAMIDRLQRVTVKLTLADEVRGNTNAVHRA